MTSLITTTHTFAEETIQDVWAEAFQLMQDNHAESGVLSKADFAPDRERYELLEKSGATRTFTMRITTVSALTGYTTGALTGYAVFFVNRDLDYALVVGTCSVIYVQPSHRPGGAAIEFVRWIIETLKHGKIPCDVVTFGSVNGRTDWSRTLLRMGFAEAETKYVKRLD